MVLYLQKELKVVRVKNRFENDVVEEVSVHELLQEFHRAELAGEDEGDDKSSSLSSSSHDKQYRDVMLNVEMIGPDGLPFICEIHVMLASIAILKKSEQKVYTIMRMQRATELRDIFVFSKET